jgi:membrane protein implicated in regulation of membrane protease activity
MIGKLLVILIIIRYVHVAYDSHAMCASSSTLFMVEVGLGEIMLCLMCLGECAMDLLLFIILAILLLYFHVRTQKKLLRRWDPNARKIRLVFGFQKLL